ncbi:lipopolysaccharide assembly protein LapA domain-containing protein [Algihabitans sp.]|uniref:lipopolysaccharide assembly protein LapA domain-containing protein n=1 Tax=Algihabitans sp. TaxID=2821514 RepID=UPI003BAC1447
MPLIRLIVSLVLLVFAAACVLFAILNHEAVMVDLVIDRLPVPLFLLTLVPLALGVLIGWFLAWLKAGQTRREKRREHKRVRELEREVDGMKARKTEAERRQVTPAMTPAAVPGLAPPRGQSQLAAPAGER